jgi:hypothetical protein
MPIYITLLRSVGEESRIRANCNRTARPGLRGGVSACAGRGHGFARPVNNMAMMMASERFLAERLGGRYQTGGTPEVVAR